MAYKNFDKFLNGCAGKTKHKTYLSAEYFLDNRHTATGAKIYKCKQCGHFHIGGGEEISNITKKHIALLKESEHKNKHKKFKY